ncbi:MAG: 50S ribosomal protein L17 [Acidobacteria bacterium]|nr:50S ribosomal protein L17 [Acidobacteriota bacterium]
MKGKKLGRVTEHRNAMFRTMVTSFFDHEHLVTTVPRAKAVRPVAEQMITLGKRETLHARRQAARFIRKKSVLRKLFDEIAPRFADRPGGYTRIIRLGWRKGDAAEMALFELLGSEHQPAEADRKKSKKPAARRAESKA